MKANKEHQSEFWRQWYRLMSLSLSIVFGIVGIVFLVLPAKVLGFFNAISLQYGLPAAPAHGTSFFLILAVAYMVLVSMLAFMMYRNPGSSSYPLLLITGKSASSIVSILFIIGESYSLIYIVNAITDGSIAVGVFMLHRKVRELST